MKDPTELEVLATEKLQKVLGEERGLDLLDRTLARGDFRLHTPADLARFGAMLKELGGFEAVLGSMLSVQATMRSVRKVAKD